MSKIDIIRQGESLVFSFDLGTTVITDYVCTIDVKQHVSDSSSVSRVITPTGNVWSGYLTSTETAALTPGMWILNASMVNSVTDERVNIPVRFQVTPSMG